MKPKIEFFSDVRDLSQRIDSPGINGPGSRGDTERKQTSLQVCLDPLPQKPHVHTKLLVRFDNAYLLAPETEYVSCFGERMMRLIRDIQCHRCAGAPEARNRNIGRVRCVTHAARMTARFRAMSDVERVKVRH